MRRRRRVLLPLFILFAATVAVVAGLYAAARREPDFYTAAVREGNDPSPGSSELLTRFNELQNDIQTGNPKWGKSFTAAELNAFLRDQLDEGGLLAEILPTGVQTPRVAIDGDRLKIGARLQVAPAEGLASDATTTVISLELKMWAVRPEPNTVAVEVVGVKAGGLPVGSQRYLDRFAEACRRANIEVTWYRADGNPVALMKFYADQARPPAVVRSVTIGDGKLTVTGQSALAALAAPAGP